MISSSLPLTFLLHIFSYVTGRGHTLMDRDLYLPKRWLNDPKRCREAGIPEATHFRTKCELASQMLERMWQAQIAIRWVVADCVYGSNAALRAWLQAHQYFFVLAVRCTEPITIQTPTGRVRMAVAEAEVRFIQPTDWQRMRDGGRNQRVTVVRLGLLADLGSLRR